MGILFLAFLMDEKFQYEYFHEMPWDVAEELRNTPGITIGEFMTMYKQPAWCECPDALAGGKMVCLGLWYGYVSKQGYKYCENCDLNNKRVCGEQGENNS